jgi:succinate dehydrogenase / fumarate reductase cytochrome b subunit
LGTHRLFAFLGGFYDFLIASFEILALLVLVGVIALLYHLLHGFQSAFQSLGINHKKYTPFIKKAGIWFSIIVCALFAAMPITMHLGLIK